MTSHCPSHDWDRECDRQEAAHLDSIIGELVHLAETYYLPALLSNPTRSLSFYHDKNMIKEAYTIAAEVLEAREKIQNAGSGYTSLPLKSFDEAVNEDWTYAFWKTYGERLLP